MYYVAVKAPPRYHQMTLEELLYGTSRDMLVTQNETNTRTYEMESVGEKFLRGFYVEPMIRMLEKFNESTAELRSVNRRELYHSFFIPKKNGGKRHIDAPRPELMDALRRLKTMFEVAFYPINRETSIQTTYYHTSAFAYIAGRCTVDAVKRHQANESRWFGKLDFSNFFGTTTLDFAMRMLSMVFPFCEICRTDRGREELRKAVELGFLDGVLPQGTPLSPLLTNIIMLPIDFRLSSKLRDVDGNSFVYTRYADDMLISSRYNFNIHQIEDVVLSVLSDFDAPYRLNREKTRYGSSSGSNWNLGVMLNKDNKITVGYKNKQRFQAMLATYAADHNNGVRWDYGDLMHMEGLRSYYRSVEGDTIDRIVKHVGDKFHLDIVSAIKSDLRPA